MAASMARSCPGSKSPPLPSGFSEMESARTLPVRTLSAITPSARTVQPARTSTIAIQPIPETPKRRELRWKTLGSGWDTFIILRGIVGESTKNPSGARIIGIVTAVNRNDDRAWQALAACDMAELRADFFDPDRIAVEARAFREECRRHLGSCTENILPLRRSHTGVAWPYDTASDP